VLVDLFILQPSCTSKALNIQPLPILCLGYDFS